MKKILALILAAMMLLSVVACNSTPADNNDDKPAGDTTVADTTVAEDEKDDGVIAPEVEEGTLGETLWNAFLAAKAENAEITAEELANALVTNPAIQFMGGAMPLEEGQEFFSGFDEYVITGYESGALYMPMIGSIPFIGYIFELAEGADVAAFVKALSDNCNPSWNICVTADQVTIGALDTTVFFLMSPKALEGEGGSSDEPSFIYPNVDDGTLGVAYWNAFENMMIDGMYTTTEEIANALATAGLIPASLGAMPVEPGLLTGFDNYEIGGFTSGAVFMPMIGSIPFVGYILEVEEGIDVANYVADLEANCNPSWNICVTADQVVAGACNNTVFFLMCPISAE